MKSKPDQVKTKTAEKQKVDKSYDFLDVTKPFDFVGLYKTVDETNNILEKYKSDKNTAKSNLKSPKREHSYCKRNKKSTREQEPILVSQININASSLSSGKGACPNISDHPTSTPNGSSQYQGASVKSIMKNASLADQSADSARSSNSKPKKRNKSVSFMLDDIEEVMVKRTKSDDLINGKNSENSVINKKKKTHKIKNNRHSVKENTAAEVNKQNLEPDNSQVEVTAVIGPTLGSKSSNSASSSNEKKKKIKKNKPETNEAVSNNSDITPDTKVAKKLKKNKPVKQTIANKRESGDGDDEPVPKSRKTETNPDITEDLENLSIGDNAHTLSSMLDEMTVVDKEKRKKMKQKLNKTKKQRNSVKEEIEKTEEVKEKVKWKKRKWNKDKKGEINIENQETMIIVENLPIKIMMNYKKLLSDYFVKYGLIKRVGMAEVYPTEEPKPVFTTTITFNSDGAAEMALEENNTMFEGSRIRVKRPLPPTETTIVVRSYAELTDQNISSTFLGLGKIRSIKHLVKGKKSKATTFVEFDGPEAVKRAISKTVDFRIGGKKVHVAKFEPRQKKNKEEKPKSEDSAADADNEDSYD